MCPPNTNENNSSANDAHGVFWTISENNVRLLGKMAHEILSLTASYGHTFFAERAAPLTGAERVRKS